MYRLFFSSFDPDAVVCQASSTWFEVVPSPTISNRCSFGANVVPKTQSTLELHESCVFDFIPMRPPQFAVPSESLGVSVSRSQERCGHRDERRARGFQDYRQALAPVG